MRKHANYRPPKQKNFFQKNKSLSLRPGRKLTGLSIDPISIENRWLATKSDSTRKQYIWEIDRLRMWLSAHGIDPRSIFTISDVHAREYREWLTKRMGPAAVKRTLDVLSSYWSAAAREGRAVGIDLPNPWRQSILPRPRVASRMPRRILSEEEVGRILAACREPVERALILLLYDAGLRVQEAVTAKWSDVGRTAGGYILTVTGKGSKTRTVGLSARALAALRAIREDGILWLFPGWGQDGHLSRVTAWRIVRDVSARAGIRTDERDVSPHWLRHSHATHSLQHGADLITVRDSLGHSSIRTTERYLHARPGRLSTDFIPGADRRGDG
jgi:site-specific recombinase XerD